MRFFGHVLRRGEHTEMGRVKQWKWQRREEEEDQEGDGRISLRMILRVIGLEKGMTMDRETWRRGIHGLVNLC